MQNPTITTTVHRNDVEVSVDWAAEAEALAQRVTSKIRRPTLATARPVVADEYEPQTLDERPASARRQPAR